jgi:hypothetical protein
VTRPAATTAARAPAGGRDRELTDIRRQAGAGSVHQVRPLNLMRARSGAALALSACAAAVVIGVAVTDRVQHLGEEQAEADGDQRPG